MLLPHRGGRLPKSAAPHGVAGVPVQHRVDFVGKDETARVYRVREGVGFLDAEALPE